MNLAIENLKKNWVLVVIGLVILLLIVGAVLLVGIPIIVSLAMMGSNPEMCQFDPGVGFICNTPMPVIIDNTIDVRLYNGNPQKVNILGVGCSNDPQSKNVDNSATTTISQGGFADITANCNHNSKGNFQGYLIVEYNYEDDVLNNGRFATATMNVHIN